MRTKCDGRLVGRLADDHGRPSGCVEPEAKHRRLDLLDVCADDDGNVDPGPAYCSNPEVVADIATCADIADIAAFRPFTPGFDTDDVRDPSGSHPCGGQGPSTTRVRLCSGGANGGDELLECATAGSAEDPALFWEGAVQLDDDCRDFWDTLLSDVEGGHGTEAATDDVCFFCGQVGLCECFSLGTSNTHATDTPAINVCFWCGQIGGCECMSTDAGDGASHDTKSSHYALHGLWPPLCFFSLWAFLCTHTCILSYFTAVTLFAHLLAHLYCFATLSFRH